MLDRIPEALADLEEHEAVELVRHELAAGTSPAALRSRVKVMIGGGPGDGSICRTVGADDRAADAQAAVRLSLNWLEEHS